MARNYRIEAGGWGLFPMGVTAVAGGIHITHVTAAEACALILYRGNHAGRRARIAFPAESRRGNVWSLTVFGEFDGLQYVFEEDGCETADPCGRAFEARGRWGRRVPLSRPLRALIPASEEAFDWNGDRRPQLPFENCIFYHLHPRMFTRHPSSGVSRAARGTFAGIIEKISYLKNLGVTTVLMMPPAEFEECIWPREMAAAADKPSPAPRLNCWGYTAGRLFAPKEAYAGGQGAAREFKELVRALHVAGMELVIDLFFDGSENPFLVLEALRWWAGEYHIDGVRLVGYAPLKLLAEDPYLADLKLLAESWEGTDPGTRRHLAECGPAFLYDMRSYLKGDEGKLNSLVYHTRHNPERVAAVNYMADVNGFTLMDMVSYNEKHNEANGEDNHDGSDYNQSWNCGVEGPTRKKRVRSLRRRQLRNAMLLLLLSQGTPMIQAGDEFGRTKLGNNNSYCQDNTLTWLNWELLKSNGDIFEFMRHTIAFRRAHRVFCMEKEPLLMDYRSLGLPDVSYHGVKAWYPQFDDYHRQLGIFYCGPYGSRDDGSDDDYFYVAYNMHWEPHSFALPNLPDGLSWHLAFDTDDEAHNGFYAEGEEPLLEKQRETMVMARSIRVLIGRAEAAGRKAEGKNASTEKGN